MPERGESSLQGEKEGQGVTALQAARLLLRDESVPCGPALATGPVMGAPLEGASAPRITGWRDRPAMAVERLCFSDSGYAAWSLIATVISPACVPQVTPWTETMKAIKRKLGLILGMIVSVMLAVTFMVCQNVVQVAELEVRSSPVLAQLLA